MKALNLAAILAIGIFFMCATKGNAQCKEEQKTLDDLQKEYNVLFVDLEKQSEDLRKILPDSNKVPSVPGHHLSFDVTMKKKEISFDLIEVTMKNRTMAFHLPQVTMKIKSFSIPTTKTEWKVTNIGFGIKTKTLVVTNGMKKISFKIPEVKMERTEIITKVPEFTKKRKDIILDLPQFKMKSPIPEEGQYKDLEQKSVLVAQQADTLGKTGARLEKEQKEKSKVAVGNLFACIEKELELQKIQSKKSYEENLVQINAAIKEVKSHGLNPEQVKSDDGTVTNLYEAKDSLSKGYEETMKNIDLALSELREQLSKIMGDLDV